jgi:hypothetical protein
MAKLRSICAQIGCEDAQTYIQSGNLACTFSLAAEALEKQLEAAIAQELDLAIPVVVRTATSWARYVKNNPFPNESRKESNRVLLCLSKRPPALDEAQGSRQFRRWLYEPRERRNRREKSMRIVPIRLAVPPNALRRAELTVRGFALERAGPST